MNIKNFYYNPVWKKIETDLRYNLGQRELQALIRFLPIVHKFILRPVNILHLATATGREVPQIIQNISQIKKYLLNDICALVIQKTSQQMSQKFPEVAFSATVADIEKVGEIKKLRGKLTGPTLILLAANGVIFSNRQMDRNIFEAMRKGDLFLLTLEMPHEKMFESYLIPPVLKLLSKSGIKVTRDNIQTCYEENSQCMTIYCNGKLLLSSYKPTVPQLRERMSEAGFSEVAIKKYDDLHMITSLWEKHN